jgi:hypothetical protein
MADSRASWLDALELGTVPAPSAAPASCILCTNSINAARRCGPPHVLVRDEEFVEVGAIERPRRSDTTGTIAN